MFSHKYSQLMISKKGIQEFTTYYHRYSWLINLPFVIYFAISFFQIGKMKSEVKVIKEILVDQANKNVISSQDNYERISFTANKTKKKRNLYKSIQFPLQNVQNSNFIVSEDWLGEVSNLDNQIQELLGVKNTIFKFNRNELQWGNKYPAIKNYITSLYATEIINILYSQMNTGWCGMYLCKWFYPIIQKYGDDLLLYPSVYNVCDPKYDELWVNGIKLEKNKYLFKPTHQGLYTLDIEYKYLHQSFSPEIIRVKKELLVN